MATLYLFVSRVDNDYRRNEFLHPVVGPAKDEALPDSRVSLQLVLYLCRGHMVVLVPENKKGEVRVILVKQVTPAKSIN